MKKAVDILVLHIERQMQWDLIKAYDTGGEAQLVCEQHGCWCKSQQHQCCITILISGICFPSSSSSNLISWSPADGWHQKPWGHQNADAARPAELPWRIAMPQRNAIMPCGIAMPPPFTCNMWSNGKAHAPHLGYIRVSSQFIGSL